MYWQEKGDSILLYLVSDRGGRRGWFCNVCEGLTLLLVAVCMWVQQVVLRDSVTCVGEGSQLLLRLVNVGGSRCG